MKIHTLTREQIVPAPLDRVFDFFSKPENLSFLTPPELGFVILTPRPIAMKQGALIDYTIRLAGVRVRWTPLIAEYEAGRMFVDEQAKGPYACWRHSHSFDAVPGGTLVRDEVRYAMPFGPLGALVHTLAVRGRLRSIFDFREAVIRKLFTTEKAAA